MTPRLSPVVEVPLETLYLEAPGLSNPRTTSGLDDPSIAELAEDIARRGLRYPLTVWEVDEECRVVLSGQRRLRALQLLAEQGRWIPDQSIDGFVPVRAYRGATLDEARAEALADNVHRSQLSSYEVARALSEMHDKTVAQIAESVGMSPGYVSVLLTAVRDGPPELVQKWRAGELSARAVYESTVNPQDRRPTRSASRPSERPSVATLRKLARRIEQEVRQPRRKADESAGEYEYLDGIYHALRFAIGEGEPDDEHERAWRNYTGRKR